MMYTHRTTKAEREREREPHNHRSSKAEIQRVIMLELGAGGDRVVDGVVVVDGDRSWCRGVLRICFVTPPAAVHPYHQVGLASAWRGPQQEEPS